VASPIESQTTKIQKWIVLLQAGDASARDELLNCACDRLRRLTHKMLKSYPRLGRWEQTDDVFQNATMRLCRALNKSAPKSARHFFKLAALQIRRELIDLGRHHFGPEGDGAHHDTDGRPDESQNSAREFPATPQTTSDPRKLAQWTEFHEQAGALPAEEREVFDLLWYQGLSQADAMHVLGITKRTLQRRWLSARSKLFDALKGALPE